MIDENEMFVNAKLYRAREFEQTRKTIAYHEAGHFVVQYITGLIPKSTEIDEAGDNGLAKYTVKPSGCSKELDELPVSAQRLGACLLAAMYQAGGIAERMYTKTSVDGVVMSHGTDDKASRKLLSMVGLSPLCKYPDSLAKEILKNQWEMVDKVAQKLLLDGRIDWDQSQLEDMAA